MSLIRQIKATHSLLKNSPLLYTAVRNHWNKDFKPLPYPVNEQERMASAEKYGLHPCEYKPYPDDGTGAGDYPNLPLESGDSKDPYYPWDNPELKRNFNEPLHYDFDLIREDRYDVSYKHRLPIWMYFAQFFGVMFGSFALYAFCENFKMFPAVIPKQFPQDGTHYTFEQKQE